MTRPATVRGLLKFPNVTLVVSSASSRSGEIPHTPATASLASPANAGEWPASFTRRRSVTIAAWRANTNRRARNPLSLQRWVPRCRASSASIPP